MSTPLPPRQPDDPRWPELRDHGTEPVSPSFVERTLASVAGDQDVAWSRLLAQHVVPAPSADFVARTTTLVLTAVRPARPATLRSEPGAGATVDAAPGRRRPTRPAPARRSALPWVAAAAVLLGGVWLGVDFFGRRATTDDTAVRPQVVAGVVVAGVWADAHPVARTFGQVTRAATAVVDADDFFSRVRFDHVDGPSLLARMK